MIRVSELWILERIRVMRNFKSQEEFIEGVIKDPSLYRKYIKGKKPMPLSTLFGLLNKLDVPDDFVFNEYMKIYSNETKTVLGYYNAAVTDNLELAKSLVKSFDESSILKPENLTLFKFSSLLIDYKNKKIHKEWFRSSIIELVKYPEVLKMESLTYLEFLLLSNLLAFSKEKIADDILAKLIISVKSNNFEYSEEYIRNGVLVSYADIAKELINRQKYDESLTFIENGISLCISYHVHYLLDFFYFYMACCYDGKKDTPSRDKFLFKCAHILLIDENESQIKFIKFLVDCAFSIDFEPFLNKYK